jgi:hypothetical protein
MSDYWGLPAFVQGIFTTTSDPFSIITSSALLKPPSILSILQTGDFWDPETDTTKSHSLSSSLPLDQSSFLHLRRVARTKCLLIRTKHPFPSLLRKLCLGRGPAFGGVSQAHSTVQRGLSLYLLRVQKRRPSRT